MDQCHYIIYQTSNTAQNRPSRLGSSTFKQLAKREYIQIGNSKL